MNSHPKNFLSVFICTSSEFAIVCVVSTVNFISWEPHTGANESSKQSRSEKKSRKAMLRLGMKPIPSVSRVTIKRAKNVRLVFFF